LPRAEGARTLPGMQYPRVLSLFLALAIGCGDNNKAPADGSPPDGNGSGSDHVCSLSLATASLDGGTYDDRFTVPGFTGFDGHSPTVYDFARDVDGSLVAAGEFRYLGGDHVEPLLRWKNGVWQPARATWELTPPGSGFSAVAIDTDGKLALATYDDFGDRDGEIWLDDGSGLRVIGTFDGLIRTLTWYQGKLWAAGSDQITTPATPIPGLAVWNGTTWTAPPGGKVNSDVYELVLDGTSLLVGGSFTSIGGIAAKSVASYDGTTWHALNFPNVAVYALARDATNQLYAGGTFGDLFGATGGIARWTGTAWELAAGGLGNGFIVGVATDLTLHDGSLYVSGCFKSAGGADDDPNAVVSHGIARFDGQWHGLDDGTHGVFGPWIEPQACGDEGPGSVWDVSKQRMVSDGNRLVLAGSFPGVAGVMSQGVIAYDGQSWVPQGPTGLGIGGSIDRIGASSSCDVWGMGQFTHVAGAPAHGRVVHFTGSAWEPITDTIPSDSYCPGFAVSAAGEVSVGCMIFPPKGDAVGRIYRVSGTELVQVGDDLPLVQAIAYDPDGHLWIAGGGSTGFVGRLDGTTFTTIEDGFDAPVGQLDVASGTDIIAGGSFTKVGTLDAAHVARWDGAAWKALGAGLPGAPTAIAHAADKVYASTVDEGFGQLTLGAFDGTAWTELATHAAGFTSMAIYNFNALRILGDAVIGVGTAPLDDGSGRGALVYQNGQFRPLGGGVHASLLSDIAITSDAIWIAGSIAEAGPENGLKSSVGVARYVIAR